MSRFWVRPAYNENPGLPPMPKTAAALALTWTPSGASSATSVESSMNMSAVGQINVVEAHEFERSSLMLLSVRIDVTFHVGISASMSHCQLPFTFAMAPEKSDGCTCRPLIGCQVGPPLAVTVMLQLVVLVYERFAFSAVGVSEPLCSAITACPVTAGVAAAPVVGALPPFHVAVSVVTLTPGASVIGSAMLPVICETVLPVALLTEPDRSSGVLPIVIRLSAVADSENVPLVETEPVIATVPPLPSSADRAAVPVVCPLSPGAKVSVVEPDQPVGSCRKAKLGVVMEPLNWVAWPLPGKTRLSGVEPIESGLIFHDEGSLSLPDVISTPAGE